MNLVTGATGLLGSHICEKLSQAGQPVRALVRKTSDIRALESFDNVEIAYGDITDPASLKEAFKGVKRVYHTAAAVGDWGSWEKYFVPVTIGGTKNMIDAAIAEGGLERFVHISSISAYGHVNGKGVVVDETYPLGQHLYKWAYYSRAKAEAEKLVWAAHNRGDLPVTCCKPSWLYGPRDRASMPRIIRAIRKGKAKLIGGGKNRLNLTYAGNEAEGCILAGTKDIALGQNYNLSCDGHITLEQYFNKIAECLGEKPVTKTVPYSVAYNAGFLMECIGRLIRKPPLVTRYSVWMMARDAYFSEEKARKELGWTPTVDYDEGIQRAVRWCVDNVEECK